MCSFVLCFLIGMMLSVDLVTAGEKKTKTWLLMPLQSFCRIVWDKDQQLLLPLASR
jgi:hypothetical protein